MAILGVTDYTNTYAADRANASSSLNGDSQAYLNSLKEKYPAIRSGLRSLQGRTMTRYSVQVPLLTKMGKYLTGWLAGAGTQWRTLARFIKKRYRSR